MTLRFLSPEAAVLAVLALLPLGALAVSGERGRRVRRVLGLADPGRTSAVVPALAIAGIAALLALAAAQPVLADERARGVRSDVQAMFVLDSSRSMLAAPPGGRTRFQRARTSALALRAAIPDVPVGAASLTDRLLPHIFPTADAAAFRGTVQRALAADRPPPAGIWTRATSFDPLGDVVSRNFFPRTLRRRVIVVFTDGEARPARVPQLVQTLRQTEGVRMLFVRFWAPSERVVGAQGRPEPGYRPDPNALRGLLRLTRPLGAQVLDERESDTVEEAVRRAVGRGPVAERPAERESLEIAPFAVALGLAPLAFLLWTRNRA